MLHRRLRIIAAVLGLAVISGDSFAAENWPVSFGQYIAQVRSTVETSDMDGYWAAVKNPNGALLLDVREENEFEAGHLTCLGRKIRCCRVRFATPA